MIVLLVTTLTAAALRCHYLLLFLVLSSIEISCELISLIDCHCMSYLMQVSDI